MEKGGISDDKRANLASLSLGYSGNACGFQPPCQPEGTREKEGYVQTISAPTDLDLFVCDRHARLLSPEPAV